jgi:hypothetical protein
MDSKQLWYLPPMQRRPLSYTAITDTVNPESDIYFHFYFIFFIYLIYFFFYNFKKGGEIKKIYFDRDSGMILPTGSWEPQAVRSIGGQSVNICLRERSNS